MKKTYTKRKTLIDDQGIHEKTDYTGIIVRIICYVMIIVLITLSILAFINL